MSGRSTAALLVIAVLAAPPVHAQSVEEFYKGKRITITVGYGPGGGYDVFARLLAAIDNFTVAPSTFIDGGDHVVVLGRYGGTMKDGGATLDSAFCHVIGFHGDKIVTFQQYTDTAQWARLMA